VLSSTSPGPVPPQPGGHRGELPRWDRHGWPGGTPAALPAGSLAALGLVELLTRPRAEVGFGAAAHKTTVPYAGQLSLFLVFSNPLLRGYKPGQVL